MQLIGVLGAALRCSHPAARGILVPWAGMEPTSPALEGGFLTTTWLTGSPAFYSWMWMFMWWTLDWHLFFYFFGLAFITPSRSRYLETGLPHGSLVPPNDVPATAMGKLALRQTALCTVQALSHFIPSVLDLQASANPGLKNKNPKNPRRHLADWFLAFRIAQLLLWLV